MVLDDEWYYVLKYTVASKSIKITCIEENYCPKAGKLGAVHLDVPQWLNDLVQNPESDPVYVEFRGVNRHYGVVAEQEDVLEGHRTVRDAEQQLLAGMRSQQCHLARRNHAQTSLSGAKRKASLTTSPDENIQHSTTNKKKILDRILLLLAVIIKLI